MEKCYNRSDVGCYVDGVHGDEHLRHVLYDLLEGTETESVEIVRRELLENDVEIQSDAILSAVEILQSMTQEGFVWYLDAGDLILMDEKELQSI